MESKGKKIGYVASTGLVAFAMAAGGVYDILSSPEVVEQVAALGYPAYFARMLGIWKVLGAVAIVAPGFPRLKEWAYAGITIDLVAAAVAHVAVGDPVDKAVIPLVLLAVALASWALRPASRRLAGPTETGTAT